jgi:MerR family copper efflux transcriptional regulator
MERGLSVGRLAEAAGVKASTVRYYEQLGLLPRAHRTAAGYRIFPADAARRIALIRTSQQFGFPLRDIAGFFRMRDAGETPCHHVRDAGRELLHTLDAEILSLRAKRQQIRRTLRAWDEILSRTPTNQPAYLLEAIKHRSHRPRNRQNWTKARRP